MNVESVKGYWDYEGKMPVGQFVDFNQDGWFDIVNWFTVKLNSGKGMPGFFAKRVELVQPGARVSHPVKHGDENSGITPCDFDGDGDLDIIYGTHAGYLYLHRNNGTLLKPEIDLEGEKLTLTTGGQVKVGLAEGTEAEEFDFTVLQGARPKPVAGDFNLDGKTDMIIGDTYGKVRYFENVGTNDEPLFAEPVLVIDRKSRIPSLLICDYNDDGKTDMLMVKGQVYIFLNESSPGKFLLGKPEKIKLPMPTGSLYFASMVDYNQDGDEDFIYRTSHGSTCFAEKSFLKHGYKKATIMSFNKLSMEDYHGP